MADQQGGKTSSLSDLLSNKLFLHFLSSAGQDMVSTGSFGPTLGKDVKQTIATQNYAELIKNLLSGGANININKDKVNISTPINPTQQQQQQQIGLMDENPIATQGSKTAAPIKTNDQQQQQNTGIINFISKLLGGSDTGNPTSSPLDNINVSNLAGLTPQDITEALKVKMTQDVAAASSAAAKEKNIIDQMKLAVDIANLSKKSDEPTADIKNYQYAVKHGYTGSFEDFKNISGSTSYSDYQKAKAEGFEGSFLDWKTEIAKAGRPTTNVNIDTKLSDKLAMASIQTRLDLRTGAIKSDINRSAEKYADRAEVASLQGNPSKYKETIRKFKVNSLQSRIKNAGGKVISYKYDKANGVMQFSVEWPDGSVEDYTYGLDD